MLAESPKYPALYDVDSGVAFSHGRAEVTEDQALLLAERRFVDGVLIEGVPAKKWAADRKRDLDDQSSEDTPAENVPDAPPLPDAEEPQASSSTRTRSK